MQRLVDEVSRIVPVFVVKTRDVELIETPPAFLRTVLREIDNAQRRIVISSLYIGTDAASLTIIDRLRRRLEEAPDLTVHFALDHSRSSRGQTNTFTVLHPLVAQFGSDRVVVLAYKNPPAAKLHRLSRLLPVKLREIIGVHHMKYLVFDNHALLTGANLNQSYYEDRIDRYILFRNTAALSQYMADVTASLGGLYHRLAANGEFTEPTHEAIALPQHAAQPEDMASLNDAILVAPCLQLRNHAIVQDSAVSDAIFSQFSRLVAPDTSICLCTGYFNPSARMQNWIAKSNHKWNILTSSPEANSFFKSNGPSGLIPRLYHHHLTRFIRKSHREGLQTTCFEFVRPSHTFHAKARFIDNSILSSIGSSNFGHRSEFRDNELQFYILSKDSGFNSRIQQTFDNLFHYGKKTTLPNTRSVVTRILAKLTRSYL